MNAQRILDYASPETDGLHIKLIHPSREGTVKAIVVELIDGHPADGVRVSYDFDRDGWKIEQAQHFSWVATEPLATQVHDRGWTEVAFVKPYASKKPGPAD